MEDLKLGVNQSIAMRALLEHHSWPGGWICSNYSTTTRLLDGLVRKGLAYRRTTERGNVFYRPTAAGIAYGRSRWAGKYERGLLRTDATLPEGV
jgi:DNA-binding PadR family transcriptional regulator